MKGQTRIIMVVGMDTMAVREETVQGRNMTHELEERVIDQRVFCFLHRCLNQIKETRFLPYLQRVH